MSEKTGRTAITVACIVGASVMISALIWALADRYEIEMVGGVTSRSSTTSGAFGRSTTSGQFETEAYLVDKMTGLVWYVDGTSIKEVVKYVKVPRKQ